MCNCIEELKKRMIENRKEDNKFKNAYNFKAECDNIATVFSRDSSKTYDRPYLNFKLTAECFHIVLTVAKNTKMNRGD